MLNIDPDPILVRSSVLVSQCPWQLLTGEDTIIWRGMGSSEVWFAVGSLREFESLDAVRHAIRPIHDGGLEFAPRGFGVVAFDPDVPIAPEWQSFQARRFFLPRSLIRWRDGTSAILVLANSHDDLASQMRRVMTQIQNPPMVHVEDDNRATEQAMFTRDAWRRAIAAIRNQIQLKLLDKVVLAQQQTLTFTHDVNPVALIEQLSADAANAVVFANRRREGGVFLGATPERLFTQRRRQLSVDSLAGTRPRGQTPEEDQRLAHELSHSAKDIHEQKLVTDHIIRQMQRLCEDVVIESAPRIRQFDTVQHLSSSLEGTLRDNISLDHILNALHPTPATCGYPTATAREAINKLEPQSRGLYAGAIGWIDAHNAEFAVTIRSGLIQKHTVRLFAGAGIVADSDADAEYEECEWKLRPLRRALLDSPSVYGGIKGGLGTA